MCSLPDILPSYMYVCLRLRVAGGRQPPCTDLLVRRATDGPDSRSTASNRVKCIVEQIRARNRAGQGTVGTVEQSRQGESRGAERGVRGGGRNSKVREEGSCCPPKPMRQHSGSASSSSRSRPMSMAASARFQNHLVQTRVLEPKILRQPSASSLG